MKLRQLKVFTRLLCILLVLCILSAAVYIAVNKTAYAATASLIQANDEQIAQSSPYAAYIPQIKALIRQEIIKANIPGFAVAIVDKGDTVYQSGFGYADVASGKKVTADTLFQLASNSKAFTGLGVLFLQKDGLVNLDAPITDYLPWLTMNYQGKPVVVKVSDFLHHTSGISPSTIMNIPVDSKEGAIERTVQTLIGTELAGLPGEHYQYATINYDVLGLLIEKLSGISYEAYIQQNVLTPMGLTNTYMVRNYDAARLATGYKLSFLTPRAYEAPHYDGNRPAGYIVSTISDMAQWLKTQLNASQASTFDYTIIEASHTPDVSVKPFAEKLYYAAGWITDKAQTEVMHSGSNPNYSSNLAFLPQQGLGVAVLSNSRSDNTSILAMKIMDILAQRGNTAPQSFDLNQLLDLIGSILIAVLAVLCGVLLWGLFRITNDIRAKKRVLNVNAKVLTGIVVSSVILFAVTALLLLIPYGLFGGATWDYVFVWYPNTIQFLVFSILTGLVLSFIRILLNLLFRKATPNVKDTANI